MRNGQDNLVVSATPGTFTLTASAEITPALAPGVYTVVAQLIKYEDSTGVSDSDGKILINNPDGLFDLSILACSSYTKINLSQYINDPDPEVEWIAWGMYAYGAYTALPVFLLKLNKFQQPFSTYPPYLYTFQYLPGRVPLAGVTVTYRTYTQRITLGSTEITITPDPTLSSGGDPRSINRKALDDVEAALAAGAGSDVTEYTVAGTIIKKDRAGLLALRAYYLGQVRAEQGKPSIGTIFNYL